MELCVSSLDQISKCMWKTVLLLILIILVVTVAVFHFSPAATGNYLSWSLLECSLLLVLFTNYLDFSAKVLAKKHFDYAGSQKRVPRFVLSLNLENKQ